MNKLNTIYTLLFTVIFVLIGHLIQAQAIKTDFGKNRVQFHDDFRYWSKYETKHFITYWYGKGRKVGEVAAQMAELDHNEIRKIIEHKINDKIEIIVYVDVNDLKQSNLGSEEAFESKSGETKIVGNKMFVYFDGNHHHLRKKIREGIASVYFSAMMFGSNFQEIIQNAVLLEVPAWFAEGIVSYCGNTWNIFIEDELRDILYRDDKYNDFKRLADDHPRVAGHALWFYISQNYGKSAISNLLYLTRISRDVDNAFEFVLNTPLDQIYKECDKYYYQKYASEKGVFDLLNSKNKLKLNNKRFAPVSKIVLNPEGSILAYAHNNSGKIKIELYDFRSKKNTKIFKKGFRNTFQETDYDFPDIVWNKQGTELTYTYIFRDKMYLCKYDIKSKTTIKQLLPEIFQRIYSIDYLDDRHYVFSAATDGVSDLYVYDTKQRQEFSITNDFYDDLDATVGFYRGEKGIVFSSNRSDEHILPAKIDTILPVENFDLFFLPFEDFVNKFELEKRPKLLQRITSTIDENERYPMFSGPNKDILYLSDQHGVINSFVLSQENSQSQVINNHGRNIIRHSTSKDGSRYLITLYNNGSYEVFDEGQGFKQKGKAYTTMLRKQITSDNFLTTNQKEEKVEQIDPGMKFVTEFPDPVPLLPIEEESHYNLLPFISYPTISLDDQKEAGIIKINPARILAAGLRFKLVNVTTRLDNDVLFGGLELFDGQNQQVNQLPMGILIKAKVNDLFEDYSFEGGVRFPTAFNGSEYFAFFDNKKKLIDRRIGFYRRALTESINSDVQPFTKSKKEILLGMYQWRYPFDIYSSLRATASLRFDRAFFKTTNDITLNSPITRDKRVGAKLEYVFDNSLDYAVNIKHGTRAKVYIESYNQFELDIIDGIDFEPSKGFTTAIGFDARHYIPILRESILAFRSAGAMSLGSKKNIYQLGDVNNTFIPSFDQSIPIPGDQSFAFKTNVNHLRGFKSNIRNGSTFLVGNAELRIPIFRYFMDKNRGSSFFRDFHIVGFADAGLAWYGNSPYSDKNPLNTVFIDGPIAQIEVTYYRDPLVIGYGLGARTSILGYFLRVDYAWGVETRQVREPRWHFSFGYDF